jgi:hypothetical protein
MKPEVSRGAGAAGSSGFEARGLPPPPLHAAADPSRARLAVTTVRDRLMLIVASGFEGATDLCI